MPSPRREFHPDEQACLSFIEDEKLSRRFRLFIAQHPEVYREIVALAREAKAKGYERYGMKTLWEVTRWKLGLEMNNSLAAFMARHVMDNEPDLRGFFETRRQTAA